MALVEMILKYIHLKRSSNMFGFIKKIIKFFLLFIAMIVTIFLIFLFLYKNCDSCAFWIDRQTLLSRYKIPIPKYTTVNMLESDSMGYSVYLFKKIKGWENNYKPSWHRCKVIFNKDGRFDIPYKQYVNKTNSLNNVSKLFLISYKKISFIYIQERENIYMIILSLGTGPANNATTNIKTLDDICSQQSLGSDDNDNLIKPKS
jgi:hypothetical protein